MFGSHELELDSDLFLVLGVDGGVYLSERSISYFLDEDIFSSDSQLHHFFQIFKL